MLAVSQAADHEGVEGVLVENAANLLSQQIWCWGRDILRSEGNWLLEIGFDRTEPPAHLEDSSSVYTLTLPPERFIVLRGFGVFFGDRERGGVFLPRYTFEPRYTTQGVLESPLWSNSDLPQLDVPTEPQRSSCVSLTFDLIDWIRSYEVDIVERLGIEYRRSALGRWDNGKRSVMPAEEMARMWRLLGTAIADGFHSFYAQSHEALSPHA